MRKRIVVLSMVLTIMSVWAVGCYTVLNHPLVEGEEGETVEHTGTYYRDHCTDCHGDYHNYPYGFYYGYYPDYYWSSPQWGHYYARPWWWDRFWWDDDNYGYDDAGQEAVSSEKAERRRGMVPPYVAPEATAANTPFVLPTSTNQQSDQSGQTEKPTATKIDTQQKEKEKETEKKEKAERRRK